MSPNTNIKNSPMVFIGIIIAGLIIGGAIVYKDRNLFDSQKASLAESDVFQTNAGDHIKGNPEAPVTIIEFSDFECPYCAKFDQTMNQVMKNYQDEVKWVYRHFPLSSHSNAQSAAEAAECASEQGKFWQYHDGLFTQQARLGNDLYLELVDDLGFNRQLFQECFSSQRYRNKISADYQAGIDLGVQGTPGNFINGKPIGGAVSYDQMKIMIDSILKKNN